MKLLIKRVSEFLEKLNEDHIGEYTAQCAYFTFLSFIPFIILLLSLIKYMNIERETLIYILEAILPTITRDSVFNIIQEVYSKSFETISISAIFLLWSAGNSFYALSLGLSSIYKTNERNNYIKLRIKGIVGTSVTILTIIMVLILIVFGNKIGSIIEGNFEGFSGIIEFILSIRSVLVIVSLFFAFLLMYRFVPNRKGSKLKEHIFGALFSSIGWFVVSYFFSIYVDLFTNFSVIYGSLTTIILIMMWLYVIIYIILLGAEINVIAKKIFSNLKIKNKIS